MEKNKTLKRAFTMIELLVVIAIIGILSVMILVLISGTQGYARNSRIKSGMSQIRSAAELYKLNNDGIYTNLTNDYEISLLLEDINYQGGNVLSNFSVSWDGLYYCATTSLNSTSDLWCIDSRGYSGEGGCTNQICDNSIEGGWPCGDSFTDSRDGNLYSTVKIGNQCWIAENLKYLPLVFSPSNGSTDEARYYVHSYDGTDTDIAEATANYSTHGVLYNYPALSTACPLGWHVPTDYELKTLEIHLGMEQSEADNENWRGTNEGSRVAGGYSLWDGNILKDNVAFGLSGLNLLPSGGRALDGNFYSIGSGLGLWTSTLSGGDAWRRSLYSENSAIFRGITSKAYGYPVRCLID